MKFIFKKAVSFEWPGLKGWAYNSKKDFENASVAVFEVNGSHGKVKTTRSDRVYYILKGKGEFILDKKKVPIKATDIIIVPKGTIYDYRGKMKLFLVHIPAYDEKYEINLENKWYFLDKRFEHRPQWPTPLEIK